MCKQGTCTLIRRCSMPHQCVVYIKNHTAIPLCIQFIKIYLVVESDTHPDRTFPSYFLILIFIQILGCMYIFICLSNLVCIHIFHVNFHTKYSVLYFPKISSKKRITHRQSPFHHQCSVYNEKFSFGRIYNNPVWLIRSPTKN